MKNATRKPQSAQEIQDKIFDKMSAGERLKLASNFSMFLIRLNQSANRKNGFSKNTRKNRKNS